MLDTSYEFFFGDSDFYRTELGMLHKINSRPGIESDRYHDEIKTNEDKCPYCGRVHWTILAEQKCKEREEKCQNVKDF